MSSSNLVKLSAIEESSYGVTPATGNFQQVRFTSESLSGTPSVIKSTEIHSDRTAGGQIQVGLEVGGDVSMEMSADDMFENFIRGGMMRKVAEPAATIDLLEMQMKAIDKTLTITGEATLTAGSLIILSGFTNDKNNGPAFIKSVSATGTSPDIVTVLTISKETIADETTTDAAIDVPQKLTVGTDIVSFSIEKDYSDLTDKSVDYLGMLVNEFKLEMSYGAIAKAQFMFKGNGYEMPTTKMTDGRTIDPAGTEQPYNASSDIGTVWVGDDVADFCIQKLDITVSNGLSPQVCMGSLAPRQYALGTAAISIGGSAYLADANWDLMAKKLTQEPVRIAYSVGNIDGGMTVVVHGAQLSFPDGNAAGMDQQVSLQFSGSAKTMDSGYFDIYLY